MKTKIKPAQVPAQFFGWPPNNLQGLLSKGNAELSFKPMVLCIMVQQNLLTDCQDVAKHQI